MKRSRFRRNAFALGNDKESSESTSNLDDVVGINFTGESGVDLATEEENRPCAQLTQEQITGKIIECSSAPLNFKEKLTVCFFSVKTRGLFLESPKNFSALKSHL